MLRIVLQYYRNVKLFIARYSRIFFYNSRPNQTCER